MHRILSIRSRLSGWAFVFAHGVMLFYTRESKKKIINDGLMKLSALFLRWFMLSTLPEKYLALGQNFWMQGKHQKALKNFLRSEMKRLLIIKRNSWEDKNFIFLPRNCAQLIGLMGHMDAFIKQKILRQDSRIYYLLAPEHDIINPIFLDYWAPYIQIVKNPAEIKALTTYEQAFSVNWNWAISEGNNIYVSHHGMAKIQRQWYGEGRKPLLILNQVHQDLAKKKKKEWGMEEQDWFVCLHVRSSGYHAKVDGKSQDFRNTPIEDYYPLIDVVTQQGGWVVRMGDPCSPLIDKKRLCNPLRVIDYAHGIDRSPALDVALSASCRLFISTSSGLHLVAKSFGIPTLYINCPIYKGFPHDPFSVFIPPFYYSYRKKRILTLEEILSSQLVHADHQCHFVRSRVSLQYVQPEDMVIAVEEALVLTRDKNNFFSKNHAHNYFDYLNEKYETCINGKLGKNFLEKYKAVLGLEKSC